MSGLHVGQKVKATDPKTGKTSVRMIDKVWVNRDTDLMDVTVHSKDGVSVVHTTRKHPFWDVTTRAWTDADHLRSGDELMSAAGVPVTVTRTRVIPGAADMWDLTVDGLHDFYILTAPGTAGSRAAVVGSAGTILVHNCGESSAAARGRAMHEQFNRQLDELGEPWGRGSTTGPDRPDGWYQGEPIELKPNTPSGLRAGERQLGRYIRNFGADQGHLFTYDEDGMISLYGTYEP